MRGQTLVIGQIQQVDIADLRIASWNARKTFDPARSEELKSSIDSHGIQVPLIVRVVGGVCEIVAGHRRFYAALALWEKGDERFERVPCICRDLDDDQAREIGLVDNLQREDVPALEEADAYKELEQRLGTPAAIAARVGKDVSYVARRLQLVSLAEMPRKALAERLITVDHALLLARLGEEEQNANLKWALNPNSGIKEPVETTLEQRIQERDSTTRWSGPWEPESVLSLKHHIEQNVGRKLSRAPWSLDDATLLQDVPACNSCPSNTKHNETLFGDMNIDAATCEDGGCFELKRVAFVSIRLSDATHKQDAGLGPALRLSWKETTVKPRISEAKAGSVLIDESGINLGQTFKRGQWVEAKPKSCAHVRLGVTVDWSDANNRGFMGGEGKLRKPGQILTVCVAAKCKAHRKEWEKPKSENTNGGYDPKAEEEKWEKRRQAAIAEAKIRMIVAGEAIDAIKAIPAEALRSLVVGELPNWGDEEKSANALLPGLKKIAQTAKVDSVDFAKALAIASLSDLVPNEYQGAEHGRNVFLASVKRLGYDGSNAWKELAKPAVEPKKKAAARKAILSPAAKKRIAAAQRKRWAAAAKKKGGRK
jgi:ParB family transcriptional regulator, chromosome partitioning protein